MQAGPLIGRGAELEIGLALIDRVRSGSGSALFVEGEAGIGKSALLNAVIAGAPVRVLRGAAHELERERPLGLVLQALRSTDHPLPRTGASRLQQLLRDGASGFALSDEAVDLIEHASLEQPLVLALEDLHWADAASLIVIAELVRRLDVVGACVIATARPVPRSSELTSLVSMIEQAGGSRIALEPLDAEAALELARREFGSATSEDLGQAVERAGGNPLYLTELVHAMREDHGLADELPPSLRTTILRRLSHLSEQTLDVLRFAAVLGEEFSVAHLSAFADRTAVELEPLLREASATGVLHPTAEGLAFRHELVRDAVYQDAPLPVRRALHAQAGHALAELGAPVSSVAVHLSLGEDPDAVQWLRRAAEETNDIDPNVSVTLLRRALELLDPRDPQRVRVSTDAAIGLVYASRPLEALELARDTLAMRPDLESGVRLRHGITSALVQLGRYVEAADVWAHCAPTDLPDDLAAGVFASRANIRLQLGDVSEAVADARQAMVLGERGRDPRPVVWGSLTLAQLALYEGDLHEALETCANAPTDPSLQTALRADLRPHLHFTHALALTEAGLFDEAEKVSRLLRDIAQKSGRNSLPNAYGERGVRLYRSGAFASARAELETGLDIALRQGPSGRALVASTLLRLAVHLEDGDLADRAKSAIDGDLAAGVVQPYELERCRWALSAYDEWRGKSASVRVPLGPTAFRHLGTLEIPDRIKALVAAGENGGAEAIALAFEQAAGRPRSFQTMRALALRCRGLVCSDAEILGEAVALYRDTPLQLELTQTCEEAGTASTGSGAVLLLEEALSRYDAMGAVRDARRVEAELRERGVRRGRRGARSRPAIGWDALTATELTVVGHLCEGLTNRQIGQRMFISTRTVDSHVSNIFRKLRVGSRTQLVSLAVARREESPQRAH